MADAADTTESASKAITDAEIAELVNNTQRLVSEMQEKQFGSCRTKVDAAVVCQQLQELAKNKQDIKDKFHKTLTMNSFMRNLSKPREQWEAIVSHNEEELQGSRSRLKEMQRSVDDEKTKIMQFNAVTADALALYNKRLEGLKDRLQCLENTCQELKDMQAKLKKAGPSDDPLSSEIKSQLGQCSVDVRKCRLELLRVEHQKVETELRLARMRDQLASLHTIADRTDTDASYLARLQKTISTMEEWGGVTCEVPNPNTMVIRFLPRPASAPKDNDAEDPVLQITLTFSTTSDGAPHLVDVQSNVDSLDVADLWGKGKEGDMDSIPALIHAIKMRWFSFSPLLSEINRLQSQYAIDWIQQQGVLRVMVGKGGTIVCSLSIPASYPQQGHITLTSILGTKDSQDLQELKPSSGGRLEDWVKFLEDKFGKP